MKPRKIIFFSVIVLLLLLFGFVFRTFIRVNIVEPAAFVLWAVWKALASVNQNVYWQILIWGSIFLLLRFLPNRKISQTAYRHKSNSKEIGGSLYWHHLLSEAQFSMEKRDLLRHELETILINTLSLQEQTEKEIIHNKLNQRQYPFPDFIYRYFSETGQNWKIIIGNQWLKLVSHFPKWIQEPVTKSFTSKTRQIILWMQTQMESGYENPTLK